MASTYKTPGVYVEEISKFPPSVAAVETAIPAFIGYTEKAKKNTNDDLLFIPTRITSLLDFVEKFGGAPEINITSIDLDALNQVTSVAFDDKYYLYECIRMYYANGGSYCYIVSVGKYGDTIQNGTSNGTTPGFLTGLTATQKVDEPTLLVAPDAVLMDQNSINSLYQAMLSQCNDLQDRFCIFDLREKNATDYDAVVDDFRNGIGMNYLKYGAAYSPWIKANLPRSVNYKDIKGKIKQSGSSVSLDSLISDLAAQGLAKRLDNLIDDQSKIRALVNGLSSGFVSTDNKFDGLFNALKNSNSGNARTNLQNIINYYVDAIDAIKDTIDVGSGAAIALLDKSSPAGDTKFLFDFLKSSLNTALDSTINEIVKIVTDSASLSSAITISPDDTFPVSTSTKIYFGVGTNNLERIKPHFVDIGSLWGNLKSALDLIVSSGKSFSETIEKSTIEAIPTLKTIYRAIESEMLTLPPSATIAGIYAQIDNDRGVWKAPANVSLNNVVSVTEMIDNKKQEGLNIDVTAGKSINAIRKFTGKGILVWGARTLAGNDNEWRYVSVRRFFIFAEESIKKATEPFVFEPNDANTWVKVRAMIENFLTLQWRAGALAGAKPDQAFYVRVGLGQTMSALDILEGRMIVEIGMAVVRPAEFIILRFSHKMQES